MKTSICQHCSKLFNITPGSYGKFCSLSCGTTVRNKINLEKAKDNIKILESGKTNFGTVISGMIPGERAVGEYFNTNDAVRTKNVMEYINLISAGNAKSLGANPTDRDLLFVTSNVPNETWSDKDVADWIRRSEKAQRRTLEIARKQIETGGRYEAPLPEEPPAEGNKGGIKILKREKI